MKTTKAHFEYFKSEVLRQAERLGVTDYRIDFVHTPIDAFARFHVLATQKVVTFEFCTDWYTDSRPLNKASIAKTALHEAIHLVLADIVAIGNSRFITLDESRTAEEATVRRLQRVLKNES